MLFRSDGDGLPDAQELRFGYNPLIPSEAPDGTVVLGPALHVRRFTLGGKTYRLQSSTDLTAWTDTGDPISNLRGYSDVTLEIPEEKRFFRLVSP